MTVACNPDVWTVEVLITQELKEAAKDYFHFSGIVSYRFDEEPGRNGDARCVCEVHDYPAFTGQMLAFGATSVNPIPLRRR